MLCLTSPDRVPHESSDTLVSPPRSGSGPKSFLECLVSWSLDGVGLL